MSTQSQGRDASSAGGGPSGLSETTVAELHELASLYPQARSALLPMLHLIQSSEGCVTNEGIELCAEILDISAAEVSGVSTFYTMYKRRPVGDYHVGVCTNTLCAVMGGDLIFDRLKDHLDVGNDETTDDGRITLEHIECNAACDYAPVMMVNWEFFDNQTPESATKVVDDLRSGMKVCASRGATISKWREAERVLAGFEDGRVDEGPAAGEASLVGLKIARDNGWAAPAFDAEPRKPAHAVTESKVEAVENADTARAETETKIEESPAKTSKEGSDD
ncbi:MAG: NADH-quinone oxidoreductase subunit NuoE [Aeromicrobium sp.]